MAFNLSTYKNSSRSTEKLLAALEQSNSKKFKKDERYWELTVDKAGNGFATTRFLDSPIVDGEDGVPFVSYFRHFFKGPNGLRYVERSLTSIGLQDPVSEYNSKLWATGIKSNKDIASDQKRQKVYVSNILVINDPAKPENNGKVFLYSYGSNIFDMIQERLPELKKEGQIYDPDFKFFNPFNFLTGANFKLAARVGANKRRTYDKSTFLTPGPIAEKAEEIEKICKACYSLTAEVNASHYKSYADLKARLDVVLGIESDSALPSAETSVAAEVDDALAGGGANDDAEFDVFKRLADE